MRRNAINQLAASLPVPMLLDAVSPDGEHEEETLGKYFGPGKFTLGDTSQQKEACAVIQQFIAQELCGNLAHSSSAGELFERFPAILTRIFGPQDAATIGPGSGSGGDAGEENSWMFAATSFYSISDNLDGHEHRVGSNRGNSGSANARRPLPRKDFRSCCMKADARQLQSLLLASNSQSSGSKNLFGVLRETQAFFGFGWGLLPLQSLAALQREPRSASLLFENCRLYTHCLSQRPPSLSPVSAIAMPRQLVPYGHLAGAGRGVVGMDVVGTAPPLLMLNMLERYLFAFALYALSSSGNFYHGHGGGAGRMPPHHYHNTHVNASTRPERVALGWRRFGVRGLVHRNPYMSLLKDYLEHFFPHGSGGSGGVGFNGTDRECELFLRVLVEFWLEGNAVHRPGFPKGVADAVVYPNHHYQQQQQQQYHHHGAPNQSCRPHPGQNPAQFPTVHCDPITAEIASDYTAPTDMSLHGLLVTSAHLLADPRLLEACQSSATEAAAVANAEGGSAFPGEDASPMTPELALLRPHVFSFLRAAFSPESTMDTGSTAFSLTVELWMLWLRPWAAPAIVEGFSPCIVPKPTAQSAGGGGGARGFSSGGGGIGSAFTSFVGHRQAGTAQAGGTSGAGGGSGGRAGVAVESVGEYRANPWAAWVLENYSMYATIMAAFIRKAVNMSLKVGKDGGGDGGGAHRGGSATRSAFEPGTGRANLELVCRISEVYCADITDLLRRCQSTVQNSGLDTSANRLPPTAGGGEGRPAGGDESRGGGAARAPTGGLGFAEARILEGGRQALSGIQGPQLVTLPSYKEDAMEVLELIAELACPATPRGRLQKMKQKVSHAVGSEGNDNVKRAQTIGTKLMQLFDVPAQWRPKGHTEPDVAGGTKAGLSVMFKPDRDVQAPSYLSKEGHAQLTSGRRACKPWDVSYVGDPMYCPLRSWEIQWSVDFWVGLSEKFNERWLGWTSPPLESDDRVSEGSFEDEGPSRSIVMAKKYQQRVVWEGRWARLPRRLNLRPLADVRATAGFLMATYLLMQAWQWNSTFGASLSAVYAGLAFRISMMDLL